MQQIPKLSQAFDKLPEGSHNLPAPVSPTGEVLFNVPLTEKRLGELIVKREGKEVKITAGENQNDIQFRVRKQGTNSEVVDVFENPVSDVTIRRTDSNSWRVIKPEGGIEDPDALKQATDIMLQHARTPSGLKAK